MALIIERKILFFLLVILISGCTPKADQKETKKEPPNILFILSDDHTSQAWGIYGGILADYAQNNNIDRLANEGMVLNNVFCTNSICTPSRGSILTGQYSHINEVYTLSEPLPRDHPNIARTLSNNGYQTAVIGKWHLVGKPEGFDYYNVLPGQGRYWNPILKTEENWIDGHDSTTGEEYEGFSTDVITGLTIEYLNKRDKNKPFLMFCNFKATHEPFDYPERFKDLYKDVEIPEPESLLDFDPKNTGRTFHGQTLERLGKRWDMATQQPDKFWTGYPGIPYPLEGLDSIQKRKKIYQKLVKDFMRCGAAIDDNIGRLLDYLEEQGIAENTVVVYTADQGYFLGEHGFFDKRLIYEESLRMPFVIRYPKEIKGGQRLDDFILNIDFAALLADYAEIDIPLYIQGESFRRNLTGTTPNNWRKQMYYRYWLHHPDRPAHFGVRNERYKLALFYGQDLGMKGTSKETTEPAWEFYDLEKDPKEMHNAYYNKEYTSIINEMKLAILEEREKYGDTDEDYEIMQSILAKEFN